MLKTRRTIPILILSLLTAGASFAQAAAVAGDEVLLRLRPTESATYPMRVDQTQNTKIDLGPMGQQDVTGTTTFEGTIQVKPLSGGGLEMKTVYDRFSMKLNQMGQEMVLDSETAGDDPQAQALEQFTGKPITVQFDDTGRVLGVSGMADIMAEMNPEAEEDPEMAALNETLKQAFSDDAMAALAQQSQTIYPQDAVGVGDTWSAAFDISNPALGNMSVNSEYTLVEFGKRKGRDAAKLDLVMDMKVDGDIPMIEQMNAMFAQQGGSMDIDFGDFASSGSLWVDLDTGLTLDSTIDQKFDVEMKLSMAEREMAMNLSVASTIRSQFVEIDP